MSHAARTSPTPTLPSRMPDGWWTGHTRYRNYVLFAATGIVLVADCILVLAGVRALGQGAGAWARFLGALGSPPGLLLVLLLAVGTFFFAIRWLRVGAKIPAVPLGPVPAPGVGLILVLHFAGFVTLSLLVLVLLSGIVV